MLPSVIGPNALRVVELLDNGNVQQVPGRCVIAPDRTHVSFLPEGPFRPGGRFEMRLAPELVYNAAGHMHAHREAGEECEGDNCEALRSNTSFCVKEFSIPESEVINLRVRIAGANPGRDAVLSFMRSTPDLLAELTALVGAIVPPGFSVVRIFALLKNGRVPLRTSADAATLVHLTLLEVVVEAK
jgi:hypothetical protein